MMTIAQPTAEFQVISGDLPDHDEHIAPAPRVSVQAFCESADTAGAVQAAAEDRRLGKAHIRVQMGGVAAAIATFQGAPTPNVVVLETETHGDDILVGLDRLSEVCDSGTQVMVIGRFNDIALYRGLMKRGVSEYVIAPVRPIDVVRGICGLFGHPDAKPVGRLLAVIGAKGGVGASTLAHNIAWMIGHDLKLDSVVADLDLAFGTAGLDFNQDPPQGIADAVFSPDRIDSAFVDRLLSKCTDNLSVLAAPATLDRVYDFASEAFDPVFDALRVSVPHVVLDVPHQWTGWTKRVLIAADHILLVASPDLANLRNTKNLIDMLVAARPNDAKPVYCLNQVGMPKRPEIKPPDFAKALGAEPIAVIPFEPAIFGTAANNGQMIAEVAAGHRVAEIIRQTTLSLTGRTDFKRPSSGLLTPLLEKLMQR
jgi:pilus assembly protein CpaE